MLKVSVRIPFRLEAEDVDVNISPCAALCSVLMIVLRVVVLMLAGMVGRATVVSQIWLISPLVRFGREVSGSVLMFWNVSELV